MDGTRKFLLTGLILLAFGASSAFAARIGIVSPKAEDTVHDNSGNLEVAVELDPDGLESGQRVRILLDGAPAAADSTGSTITLEGVPRGEHNLKAVLLDENGEAVAASEEITFYMWRASRNFPSRKP